MTQQNAPRYHLIDLFRGVLIIAMIVYHFLFDLVYIFGVNIAWFNGTAASVIRTVGAGGLILIAGISCNFSQSNLKRGVKIFLYGMALTISTLALELFGLRLFIWFGVLHLIGVGGILVGAFESKLNKIPPALGAAAALLIYAFTYGVSSGFIGFFGISLVKLPTYLYNFPGLEWLGLVTKGFSSSDFFPIFPNLFLFLAGYFVWKTVKLPDRFLTAELAPINFIGRHTLLIYLLHQPLIYGILWLVFALV
jgi:Predicted membrane protein